MRESVPTIAERRTAAPEVSVSAPRKLVSLKSKVLHLVVFWFLAWPVLSIILGALKLMSYPATQDVPAWVAFPGVAVGTLYLIPEFAVSGFLLCLLSAAVFVLFSLDDSTRMRKWIIEPAIAYLGLSLGIAIEFPAILNNPLFHVLRKTTLLGAYWALAIVLVMLGVLRHGLPKWPFRFVRAFAPVFVFVLAGWALTQLPVAGVGKDVNRGSTVILGIDSVGAESEIGTLKRFANEHGGAVYEQAITPGLLTNAVWNAIFEHRPVHEAGVALTFQSPDWNRSPYQLITEAKRHGYQTWSYFTGQNTIYVGSLAGFDHDRSGPMGWLQDATSSAKDGGILMPFVVSRLPRIPLSVVTQNQAGTYAYDLRAVVRSLLTSHDGDKPVFVVSHIGYLHDEAYPRFADLSPESRKLLLDAFLFSLEDWGGEWQINSVPGDRLNLRSWKFENVQAVITDEIRKSGFLDARNRNALLILSDHGMRTNLTNDNFRTKSYYHVPLITFGLPVRDVHQPISLLDVPGLVGLEDTTRPGPTQPLVEYANFPGKSDFRAAILRATWHRDGRIDLSSEDVKKMLGMMKPYYPAQEAFEPAGKSR